jgi:hypothetical protein
MKPNKIIALCAALTGLACVIAVMMNYQEVSAEKRMQAIKGNGFALVELFTSEGCSSCPPADKLLAKIQEESAGKPVYVLAYHVDYWDHQGWRDIYSSSQYTARQRAYSEWMRVAPIYTPQVVVNGKYEAIGSDETIVRRTINAVLSGAATANISLQAKQQDGKLEINYQVTGSDAADKLQIAVVQKHAVSNVKRGENTGRTLSHVQIVRELHSLKISPDKNGVATIKQPKDFNAEGWEILGLVQDMNNGEIRAAAKAQLQ